MDKRTQEQKKEDFLKKHRPLKDVELVKDKDTREVSFVERPKKPRTVQDAWKEQDMLRTKYETDISKIENNLVDFLKIEDPLVYNGKAIAWIRRPSNREIRGMVPRELMPFTDSPDEIPDDLLKKYDDQVHTMMAEIIMKPKWTKEKWEENNNPWFSRLFWQHIGWIVKITQVEVEGF